MASLSEAPRARSVRRPDGATAVAATPRTFRGYVVASVLLAIVGAAAALLVLPGHRFEWILAGLAAAGFLLLQLLFARRR